jgi:exosortase
MAQSPVQTSEPEGARPGIGLSLPPWPLLLVLATVAYTWRYHFLWLVEKGWHNEYYGHGFLIPLVSIYLVYRLRPQLTGLPRTGYLWGLPLLLGGLAVQLLAVRLNVNFPQGFALVTVIAGLVIWLYGWPVGRTLAFPLVFLLFMVPMGRFLVDKFAQPMQLMSARCAGVGACFMGIPADVQGTRILLPDYTFEVAIVCSGLKSAITMTALGALYAFLLVGPLWKRVLLFALSLPAALAANAIRIWLTLVLARSLGSGAADGFFHTASGMLVFLIALLLLFGVGSLLGCSTIRDDV